MTNIELPKDAEGREIPLDTDVLYSGNGFQNNIRGFLYRSKGISIKDRWIVVFANGIERFAFQMHLTPPDSWEKLEEDLDRCIKGSSLCMYYSPSGSCNDCTVFDDKDDEECEAKALRSIKYRIRNLTAKEAE